MISKYRFLEFGKYSTLVIALYLIRYWDTIFQYKIIGNAKDSVYLIGPVFKKVNQLMLDGHTPLWITEILTGVPFFNNAMFSFTYPFYFLGVIDYGSDIHILRTITLVIAFHFLLLFISNIILLRTLGFSTVISILAGFSIILCLNTAYNSTWIIALAGYTFMPLFFAGVIQMFKKDDTWLGILYLSIASLSFLAKPAQTAILAIAFGGLMTLVGLIVHRRELRRILPKFIIAGLLIIGINLPGLVQLFLDFDQLMRFTPNGPITGNNAIPVSSFRSEVKFDQTINYLLYIKKKIGVGHPWTGPMTLFALLSYWFTRSRDPRPHRWAITTFFWFVVVTIIIAFGKELPTFWIHYHTPLLGKIRESTRFLFVTNISFGVLLAYLLQYLHKELQNQEKQSILSALFVLISLVVLGLQVWITYKLLAPTIAISALGVIGAYLTYLRKFSWNHIIGVVIIVSVAYSLILPNARYGKRENSGWDKAENLEMHQTLKEIKELNLIYPNDRLVYHDTDLKDGEWANAAMLYGFRSFQGNTVCMPVNQFDDLWHQDANINYRDLWGGRWHLVNNNQVSTLPARLERKYANQYYTLLESKLALPRAWTANRIAVFDRDIKAFRRKVAKPKRIGRIAYLNEEVVESNPILQKYTVKTQSEEHTIDYTPNLLSIKTPDRPKSRLLVINEYYSDHWKPTLNGLATDLLKVNVNQMGILLPPGSHQVTLEYKPYPFIYFRYIQKFCFILILILIGILSYTSLKQV